MDKPIIGYITKVKTVLNFLILEYGKQGIGKIEISYRSL